MREGPFWNPSEEVGGGGNCLRAGTAGSSRRGVNRYSNGLLLNQRNKARDVVFCRRGRVDIDLVRMLVTLVLHRSLNTAESYFALGEEQLHALAGSRVSDRRVLALVVVAHIVERCRRGWQVPGE